MTSYKFGSGINEHKFCKICGTPMFIEVGLIFQHHVLNWMCRLNVRTLGAGKYQGCQCKSAGWSGVEGLEGEERSRVGGVTVSNTGIALCTHEPRN